MDESKINTNVISKGEGIYILNIFILHWVFTKSKQIYFEQKMSLFYPKYKGKKNWKTRERERATMEFQNVYRRYERTNKTKNWKFDVIDEIA